MKLSTVFDNTRSDLVIFDSEKEQLDAVNRSLKIFDEEIDCFEDDDYIESIDTQAQRRKVKI